MYCNLALLTCFWYIICLLCKYNFVVLLCAQEQLCSLHCAVIRVTFHDSSVTPKRIRTKIYWSFLDIALKEPRAGVDFFRVIYLKWIEIISKKPHWHTIKHFFVKKLWEVIWRDFCRPAKQLWVWHFDQNKKKGKRKW